MRVVLARCSISLPQRPTISCPCHIPHPRALTFLNSYVFCFFSIRINFAVQNALRAFGELHHLGNSAYVSAESDGTALSLLTHIHSESRLAEYLKMPATAAFRLFMQRKTTLTKTSDLYPGGAICGGRRYHLTTIQSMVLTKFLKPLTVITTLLASVPAFADDIHYQGLHFSTHTQVSSDDYSCTLYGIDDEKLTGTLVLPDSVPYGSRIIPVVEIDLTALIGSKVSGLVVPGTVELIHQFDTTRKLVVDSLKKIVFSHSQKDLRIEYLDRLNITSVHTDRTFSSYVPVFNTSLKTVTFGDHITKIGANSFAGTSITEIDIPRAVTEIGNNAFSGDSALTKVSFPPNLKNIGDAAFSGTNIASVTLPPSMTTVGEKAFDGGRIGVVDIQDSDNRLYIGPNAFSGAVDSLYLGRNIEKLPQVYQKVMAKYSGGSMVDQYAFHSPVHVTIGNKVTEYPTAVSISGTKVLHIGDGITEIPTLSFSALTSSIKELHIGKNVKTIGKVFYGCQMEKLELPEGLEKIEAEAFRYCHFNKIDLGNSLIEIGANAFEGVDCPELIIPESIEIIGDQAFKDCNFSRVSIGKNLRQIGENAFLKCTNLKEVHSHSANPPSPWGGYGIFPNLPECVLIVPFGLKAAYHRVEVWEKPFNTIRQDESPDALSLNITVDKPGNLINLIDIDKVNNIRSISLSGQLNGTDILLLNRMSNIENLDLSQASIVAGGQPYYTADNKSWHTSDGKIEQYWLNNIYPETVDIPKVSIIGNNAFLNKKCVHRAKIPSTVTTIGDMAFSGCLSLSSVTIPASVSNVLRLAFSDCSALNEVTFEGGNNKISLGSDIFRQCSALSKVVLPQNIDEIPYGMFSGCSALEIIDIPKSVKTIGISAFCFSGLKEITLPASISTINDDAFRGTPLSEIQLPATLRTIGNQAFAGCAITEATVPATVENFAMNCFESETFKTLTIENSTQPLILSNNNTKYLENIHIGRDLIYNNNLGYQISLGTDVRTATFAKGVTHINTSFYNCKNLTEIKIPSTVTNIIDMAFYGTGLTDVSVWNTTPPTMTERSFSQEVYNQATLHVLPSVRTDYWLHMYWGKFFSVVGDLPDESGITAPSNDSDIDVSISDGTIHIHADTPAVRIFDNCGRTVYSGTDTAVSGLPHGFYIVEINGKASKIIL